jgi:hypothetical protein
VESYLFRNHDGVQRGGAGPRAGTHQLGAVNDYRADAALYPTRAPSCARPLRELAQMADRREDNALIPCSTQCGARIARPRATAKPHDAEAAASALMAAAATRTGRAGIHKKTQTRETTVTPMPRSYPSCAPSCARASRELGQSAERG